MVAPIMSRPWGRQGQLGIYLDGPRPGAAGAHDVNGAMSTMRADHDFPLITASSFVTAATVLKRHEDFDLLLF